MIRILTENHNLNILPGSQFKSLEYLRSGREYDLTLSLLLVELTGEGKNIAGEYFRFTEAFMVIALYYLALVSVAMLILKKLEQRLAVPGMAAH